MAKKNKISPKPIYCLKGFSSFLFFNERYNQSKRTMVKMKSRVTPNTEMGMLFTKESATPLTNTNTKSKK